MTPDEDPNNVDIIAHGMHEWNEEWHRWFMFADKPAFHPADLLSVEARIQDLASMEALTDDAIQGLMPLVVLYRKNPYLDLSKLLALIDYLEEALGA